MSGTEKRITILVVDDEPSVCESVGKVLGRRGYQVERALSVSGALGTIEKQAQLDLIIADLMMPQAGGMELLKITKDRWPEIPVLIITGYASIASAVEAMRLGAAGYVPKPFTPEELEEAVVNVIQGPWTLPQEEEKGDSEGVIDVDMPFDAGEVAKATSPRYVERLTRSDMPLVEAKAKAVAPDFCELGGRVCKKLKTKGVCKEAECPIVVRERKKRARVEALRPLVSDPIDVDMPFSASEVAAATSQAYVASVGRDGIPNLGCWPARKPAVGRVLVVDDEVVVVNTVRKLLSSRGYAIEEAFNGRAALACVLTHEYDLVLLDMRMPDLNGLELLSKIKSRRPDLAVVIVTGYASINTAVEAIRRGASDYLGKPFTPDELYKVTDRILERKAA